MRVLGAPVGEHDYDINPAVECSDVRGDPPRCERFSGPVRGGMFNRLVPGRVRVAAGVSPMESTAMKPTRTPSRSMITGRRAAPDFAQHRRSGSGLSRSGQGSAAERHRRSLRRGCWQGQQIEPGRPQRGSDARAGCEGVAALGR